MDTRQAPTVGAIELGRDFFREIVKPAMERVCPYVADLTDDAWQEMLLLEESDR